MSQLSLASKKLFALTLLCLAIVFHSSMYPSNVPLDRLLSGGGDQLQATLSFPVTAHSSPTLMLASALPSCRAYCDPSTQSEGQVTFFILELTSAVSRITDLLAIETNHVKIKLLSFLARSNLHSRGPISQPLPTRSLPVFIPPSKIISWKNPALPTPCHAWEKTRRVRFIQVEEPIYVRSPTEDLVQNDTPKTQLGSQYPVFPSAYCFEKLPWLVPGLFGTLISAIVVLELMIQPEILRSTMKARLHAPSRINLDYQLQVADANAPGSSKVSALKHIESGLSAVMSGRLVVSLALATSNREVVVYMSSNFLVCRPSNISPRLGEIIAQDLGVLARMCTNLQATAVIDLSSINTTAYTPGANMLDNEQVAGFQDYLYSRRFIHTHIWGAYTPHLSRTPAPSYIDPQGHITSLVVPCVGVFSKNLPTCSGWTIQSALPVSLSVRNHHSCHGRVTGYESSSVLFPRIDWHILGLIVHHFSTFLRLSAAPAPLFKRGSPIASSHVFLEHLVRVNGLSPKFHLVKLFVKTIVVPDSILTSLLFGRNTQAECIDGIPLRRGLLIEWVSQGIDQPAEVAQASKLPLEQPTARQGVLDLVEQDMQVTEDPSQDERTKEVRRRTRRGGRRVKERKERRGVLAQAVSDT